MKPISPKKVRKIRAVLDAGGSQAAAARAAGIHPSTISRMLAAERAAEVPHGETAPEPEPGHGLEPDADRDLALPRDFINARDAGDLGSEDDFDAVFGVSGELESDAASVALLQPLAAPRDVVPRVVREVIGDTGHGPLFAVRILDDYEPEVELTGPMPGYLERQMAVGPPRTRPEDWQSHPAYDGPTPPPGRDPNVVTRRRRMRPGDEYRTGPSSEWSEGVERP